MVTLEELGEAIRAIVPSAVFSEDDSGELVIATGLRVTDDNIVTSI